MIFPFSFWGAFSPQSLPGLAAWYDVSRTQSMVIDSANRVSLVSDLSGNSAVNGLVLTGGASNYASTPDSAAISITGDLDIGADLRLADWTPGTTQLIVAKGTSVVPANLEYMLQVNTAGTLTLFWSTGAATLSATSSVGTGFADFARRSIRATLDVDNGAAGNTVTFYTGTTYGIWTQLGTVVTQAGVTSIQNSTNALAIGAFTGGVSGVMTGSNYRTQIYNGIAGTLVFDANFSLAAKLATSFTESSSNAATVTINTSGATGARISGERDLYQGTVANQPVYLAYSGTRYAYSNAVSGNYLSTPDSAALDIVGDIMIDGYASLTSWASGSDQTIIAKYDGTSNQRSYYLVVTAAGNLAISWSTNGLAGTIVSATSTVGLGLAANASKWIRATLDVDNGTGGNTAQFFTSDDGVTWVALGTSVVNAGVTSIFAGTATLTVGAQGATGGTSVVNGKIFRARAYNGINGTLAFDFNPATYTTGSTLTDSSSNAATITINGGATIVTAPALYFDGANDYLKAPPFSLSQPETVQFVGRQVTWIINRSIFNGNAVAQTMALFQSTTTPTVAINAGSTGPSTSSLLLKTISLVSCVFNTVSSSLRLNKSAVITGNVGAQNASGFTLSAGGDGLNPSNITANEIAIYSVAQSTAQLDQFANYAGNKWGFTV